MGCTLTVSYGSAPEMQENQSFICFFLRFFCWEKTFSGGKNQKIRCAENKKEDAEPRQGGESFMYLRDTQWCEKPTTPLRAKLFLFLRGRDLRGTFGDKSLGAGVYMRAALCADDPFLLLPPERCPSS